MPADGHYSHSARLGTSAHDSGHHAPRRLLNTVLIDDAATSGLNIERITRRVNVHSVDAERGARMGYSFPETFDDPESLERQKEVYFGLLQGSLRPGRVPWAEGGHGSGNDWGWADEEIHTQKSHLPAPQTDDVLPSESHSSYPFGRPYLAIPGHHPRASTLKPTPRTWLSDAKAWNGVGLRGNSTSGASNQPSSSSSNATAAAAASQSSREALSKPLESLPEYLCSKQSMETIPHLTSNLTSYGPPDVSWPFDAHGPGAFNWKSILSQRQHDLQVQRAIRDGTSLLEREAWFELALDELLPRGREQGTHRGGRGVNSLSFAHPHRGGGVNSLSFAHPHRGGGVNSLSFAHPHLDTGSSSQHAFYTEAELELAHFEASLKALYGEQDEEDDRRGDDDMDDDEDSDEVHQPVTRDEEDDDDEQQEQQHAAAAQGSAEQKASRQLRRLLAAGAVSDGSAGSGSSARGSQSRHGGAADELMKRLVSLRLRASGVGGASASASASASANASARTHAPQQSVFLQRASGAAVRE